MRNIKSFIVFFLLWVLSGCNLNSSSKGKSDRLDFPEPTAEQFENFENKLTEEGIYWSSSESEFLFSKMGRVICYHPNGDEKIDTGRYAKYLSGQWHFSKYDGKLRIVWNGNTRTSVTIGTIKNNWNFIGFDDRPESASEKYMYRKNLSDNTELIDYFKAKYPSE
ncbi:hypothetical protein [Candidatus Pollutiaquabacter sp.]|uniref:hypothetical protein n=1 Tax=Candidatus Pollutiaquabacter sp. TaxID=3416354 RepID=UPI003CBA2AE9|nr:hypothetical protein [Bacteroidota bacterium]